MRILTLSFLLGPAFPVAARAPAVPAELRALFDEGGSRADRLRPGSLRFLKSRASPQRSPRAGPGELPGKPLLFSSRETISESLIRAIDGTRTSLQVALYGLTHAGIADALIRAKVERGVAVSVIVDYGHVQDREPRPVPGRTRSRQIDRLLEAEIPCWALRGRGSRGLMHNKFAIFDGRWLKTGSFNWTQAADDTHYENAVFRDDPSLIAGYQAYWRWLWEQSRPVGEPQERPGRPRGPPPSDPAPSLAYKKRPWPAYSFSPQGGTQALLLEAIQRAESRIDIAMFSFYSEDLARAVVAAHERKVAVRLVLDRGQALESPAVKLLLDRPDPVPVVTLSGKGGKGVMHHKFALFDRELAATGSHNYSFNAENNNFENTLFLVGIADLAGYEAEFELLYGLGRPLAAGELEVPRPFLPPILAVHQ